MSDAEMLLLDKPTYKISELAALLSVSDDTIRRRIKHLQLETLRDGPKIIRLPKIEAERLVKWMRRHGDKK